MPKSYDVIVVGAGSAGAIAAARLAENPALRVCVIEAGGSGNGIAYRMPIMAGMLFRQRRGNWFYHTEPTPSMNGRRFFWPRGKVVGGSSAINGMIYVRGLPEDYGFWSQAGLPDWSFDRLQPFFERSIRRTDPHVPFHHCGRIPVSRGAPSNELHNVFVEAGRQAGWPVTDDFNAAPYGTGRFHFTIADGERWSAGRAMLGRMPPNLTLLTRTEVLRLVIENGRAVGVDIRGPGGAERLSAGEVVISGGAINSPMLLMRSGIGPAGHLTELGIPVIQDLPGVGENLQDHLLVRVSHACTQPVTLHNLLRADRALSAGIQAMLFRRGPATYFPLEAGGYLKSRPELDLPDLQCQFLPGLSAATLRLPFLSNPAKPQQHGFFANIFVMRPHSRGRLTLRSADPADAPVIEPGYLTDPRDVVATREGVRRLRDIFAQPAFAPYRGAELAPGPDVQSDAAIDAYVRDAADTVFHPAGTCKMGNDPMAVVDGQLRVHGIAGLRVADASIMPWITSNNINAPTMMIGERAADFILNPPVPTQNSLEMQNG